MPRNVSDRSRTWYWTPPGTSHWYGQTRPMRISRPRHIVRGHVAPDAAEHVPVLRPVGDRLLERLGDGLHRRGHPVLEPPGAGHRDLRGEDEPPALLGELAHGGHERRAGLGGQQGGPAGPGRRPAEEGDGNAAGAQVAIDQEARHPAVLEPFPEHLRARPGPSGERDDPEPQRLAVGEEPAVEGLGLQALGDGHERAAEIVDEPDPGGVPVAAVRQDHDQPPPAGPRLVEVLAADHLGACDDAHARVAGQAEGLLPVTGVALQPATGELGQLRLAQPAAGHRAQVGPELPGSLALAAGGPAPAAPEQSAGRRLGQHPHRSPAGGEAGVGQPGDDPLARPGHGAGGGGVGSDRPAACRCTSAIRWPTVTALPTRRTHSATCSA